VLPTTGDTGAQRPEAARHTHTIQLTEIFMLVNQSITADKPRDAMAYLISFYFTP